METLVYSGLLSLHTSARGEDAVLYLSSVENPLADELLDKIQGKQVTVRYWITDKQVTKEEAQEDFAKQILGKANGQFGARYSEITGYLWTDEFLKIGGHDLIYELRNAVGKWLILEIEIHKKRKK